MHPKSIYEWSYYRLGENVARPLVKISARSINIWGSKAGDFPIAYDNILIANILGMQKRGAPTPNAGVLLPSELSL